MLSRNRWFCCLPRRTYLANLLWLMLCAGTLLPSGAAEEESRPAALAPRDSLTGPPFVSCRNWAIADAKTGALVSELGADAIVDIASTTKIMTAWVILQEAQKDASLLDATLTFSERAAATEGSSCDLKAGEQLPVREMLYGLLLPSGNDAAVALAEHFGKRFEPAGKSATTDPLARFIAEMNREANRLEMSGTRYANPHGLPEKNHESSARDLVRVTLAARRHPLFREIVSTREHDVEVAAKDGKLRTLTWKSTNRLLGIAGYSGVKTGYTRAAGSCLVSTGERNGDTLVIVVLGAPSAAAAVSDSRNLYRWAWRERAKVKDVAKVEEAEGRAQPNSQ